MTAGVDFPGPDAETFRPRPVLLGLLIIAALALLGWAFYAAGPMDAVVAVVIAIILTTVAAVGWRRRLTVGPRGLLIGGIGGLRIVPWSEVVGLHLATSSRLGLTSTTIEIDLIDDDLLIFGRTDLGVDVADALVSLQHWWRAR
ncbi:MAG: PH domain-containing protein [Nakamurella sp.]